MNGIKNPTTSTSFDGQIRFTVTGPLKPFQFRLTKPDGTVSNWTTTDTFGGRVKTYSGLGPGTFKIEVDYDDSLTTQTCIKEYFIDLISSCPDDTIDVCNCGQAILIDHSIDNRVKFLNSNSDGSFPYTHYDVGTTDFTIEFWAKTDGSTAGGTYVPFSWGSETTTTTTNYGADDGYMQVVFGYDLNATAPPIQLGGTLKDGTVSFVMRHGFSGTTTLGSTDGTVLTTSDASLPAASRGRSVIETGKWNHVVITKTRYIDSATGTLRANASGVDYWKIYVNGIEYGVSIGNATQWAFESAWTDYLAVDDNDPTVPGDNLSRYIGPICLGWNVDNYPGNAKDDLKVTNFRLYKRALRRSEVQANYARGCHGDPFSCVALMIFSKLSQTQGRVTQELVHGNHGQLENYTAAFVEAGGGAWLTACCPPISTFESWKCCLQECDPDFATMTMKFNFVPSSLATFRLFGFIGLDTCPIPAKVRTTQSTNTFGWVNGGDWDGIAVPLLAAPTTTVELANYFAVYFNSLSATEKQGGVASVNMDTVTIKFPLPAESLKCGLPYTFCPYRRGAGDPNTPTEFAPFVLPGTEEFITFTQGKSVVCCLPEKPCCVDTESAMDSDIVIN